MERTNNERKQLSQQKLEKLKESLLERKQALQKEIMEDIKKEGREEYQELLKTLSYDWGDRAMAELRESTIFSYVSLKAQEIEAIDDAIARIDEGKYGRCIDCGRWIRISRLKALPYALRCLDCQRKWEMINR